jgi:molybdopterin-guanine dinucleotide biosynthesis protein A
MGSLPDVNLELEAPCANALAGVVLAGGRSQRMGYPKALLPFGHETMLQRVVRKLHQVARPIVVVLAPQQPIPELPAEVSFARDEQEGQGPLCGLWAGLSALVGRADVAFVTGCDVPLLVPQVAVELARRLGQADIVVPVEGERVHPLSAVYRVRVLPQLGELLAEGKRRPLDLIERVHAVRVPIEELRGVDPQLATFRNLNRPADYLDALREAGLTPDPRWTASLAAPDAGPTTPAGPAD